MDADENSLKKSKDNSSTSILRNVSMKRSRRGTLSGGDGTSSTTKQKIATAINHIVNRRASVSTQRPKDFLAGIIIPRNEPSTQVRNVPTSPTSDKTASQLQMQLPPPPSQQQHQQQQQQKQQQQQQQQQQEVRQQEQEQLQDIRNKSPRPPSSHSSHHLSVSPTQPSFPLSFTAEEDSFIDNNIDASDSINKINNNSSSRRFGFHGSSSQYPNSSGSSISSQKKNSLFRDNKNVPKDDRMEKLLKKAKNFLDHKQRPRSRVASLWSFIGEYILKMDFYFCRL